VLLLVGPRVDLQARLLLVGVATAIVGTLKGPKMQIYINVSLKEARKKATGPKNWDVIRIRVFT